MPTILSPRTDENEFSVLAYKADNTGTNDSAAAFQAAATAAVAYAASNGRAKLLIPSGKYKLNSPFKIIGGNVTVEAYGAYIFAGVAGQDLFRDWTSQDSSFTLNGFGLQILGGVWDMKGHTWAQGVEGSSAFTLSNSSNLLFRDITIRNVRSYHGIDINTCKDVMVENVRVEGFKNSYEWKTNVRVASTAPLTLATGFAAGQVIDGVTLVLADRILIKNQAAGQDNGIYTVTAGAPTRVSDMDVAAECNDAAVFVSLGSTQAGMSFYQSATIVTIGTTVQVWATYWLLQCKLASTANLSLNGAATVDGTAVVTADRILVKNQTLPAQNGVYAANTAGAWTRVTDADTAAELNGKSVFVTNGTVAASGTYKQTATIVTINTDAVTWASEFRKNRYFSEAVQIDNGPNAIACQNITVNNCYMGPAVDGSGLLSFGKMAGTHTDSSGQFYTNMKFTNNTSVASLSNAFQGYSFADSVIANNVILGSSERGIRMFFNSGNSGPRLSITDNVITNTVSHGIEIDGGVSQLFNDVLISGNTITSTVMVTPGTGIHVDTCDRFTVSNNAINLTSSPSSQQGIFLETVTDGQISDNRIYNNGTLGIQTSASSRLNIVDNIIEGSGDGGIWLTAVTAKCLVSGNLIVGANRLVTTSANGCIVISGNGSNNSNTITNNKFQKGSGVEATTPITLQGASFTNTEIGNNNYGADWGSGYANLSTSNNTTMKLYGQDAVNTTRLGSDVTGLTSTSYASVTGLSCALPGVGKYRFKAFVNFAFPSGTSPTVAFGVTGPASPTICAYSTSTETSATGTNVNQSGGYGQNTALSGVVTLTTVWGALIDGYVETTATGTLQIQYKVGGTTPSLTVKTGTVLMVEKVN